ncbi:type VI secretion system tube protein TssD [Aquimarina agarivorans]|uniref:type VI secretion system tube protein TssD n=1 Tax=Aquimarina agarivorans TaxID=980584 RepID=UPI000248E8B0|nr:type VI secretion system tube protein TssD [Aquimarina agarivorans]
MVIAILHIDDRAINLLHFEYDIKKAADNDGLPYGKGRLLGLILSVEATRDNAWWQYAISNQMKFDKATIELRPAILGQQKTRY